MRRQPLQSQPLHGELVDECVGPTIGEHAFDLTIDSGPEFAPFREGQQLLVRTRAPEKVGEPRGEFHVGNRRDGADAGGRR